MKLTALNQSFHSYLKVFVVPQSYFGFLGVFIQKIYFLQINLLLIIFMKVSVMEKKKTGIAQLLYLDFIIQRGT